MKYVSISKFKSFPFLFILFKIVFITILLSSVSYADVLTLAWDPPSDDPDLTYTLCYGTASNTYTTCIDAGYQTTATVENIEPGVRYYFATTASNQYGESEYSQEIDHIIPVSPADVDDDRDGYTENDGDCNDADDTINPGAVEVCGDSIDQNCDGTDAVCENQLPVADAGPDQIVTFQSVVSLNGSNSTSSGDSALSYSWRQTSGKQVQLSDTRASLPTFQAPDTEQALTFELTVTDAQGSTSDDSCIVNVSRQNEPPLSLAGSDIEVTATQLVRLDGSGSMDDGAIVSYSWTQTEGTPVALSDPNSSKPEFISPAVGPEGTSLSFLLTVTDEGGLMDTDSCIVNVISENQPPEAITVEYMEAEPDTIITLDGSLSTDIDDGIENYRWHQLEGQPVTFDNPEAAQVKFSAPAASAYGSNLLFALKVKDKNGLKKSAKSTVFVQPKTNGDLPYTVTPKLNFAKKGQSYQARASVIITDKSGAVVKNAEVEGYWSLPGFNAENTVVGYTTGAGEAKWDSERFVDSGTLSFTVTNIMKDGTSYPVSIGSSIDIP
jgi:hypothetical protein